MQGRLFVAIYNKSAPPITRVAIEMENSFLALEFKKNSNSVRMQGRRYLLAYFIGRVIRTYYNVCGERNGILLL